MVAMHATVATFDCKHTGYSTQLNTKPKTYCRAARLFYIRNIYKEERCNATVKNNDEKTVCEAVLTAAVAHETDNATYSSGGSILAWKW